MEEGKISEAKRTDKEANSHLDELCRKIDARIKRFSSSYINPPNGHRRYMAPVITAEELHAELRARFVEEIKSLDGNSGLDWEKYFLKALVFFAGRTTRNFLKDNGFDRHANSRVKMVPQESDHESQEQDLSTRAEDFAAKAALHEVGVDSAYSVFLREVERSLRQEGEKTGSDAKRRMGERRVTLFRLMQTGINQKEMAETLGADPKTVFSDLDVVRQTAREAMVRLDMVPDDLIASRESRSSQ